MNMNINESYFDDLKNIIETAISEVNSIPNFTQGANSYPLDVDTLKDVLIKKLVPINEALKAYEGKDLVKVSEKAQNIHSINKLKSAVDATIEEVESIPTFTTTVGDKSWSSEALKSSIMPHLMRSLERIGDIENVSNQIDSVRNEVINPVKNLIEKNDKKNSVFAWVGIALGVLGLMPIIYNYVEDFFSSKKDDYQMTSQQGSNTDNQLIGGLRTKIMIDESKITANYKTSELLGKIEKLILMNGNEQELKKNADELLNVNIEGMTIQGEDNIFYGLLLYFQKTGRELDIANLNSEYQRSKSKVLQPVFDIYKLDKQINNIGTNKELLESCLKKLEELRSIKSELEFISPDFSNPSKTKISIYVEGRISQLRVVKEKFHDQIWVYSAFRKNQSESYVQSLRSKGLNVEYKGMWSFSSNEYQVLYLRDDKAFNSATFKEINLGLKKPNIETISKAQSRNARMVFEKNPDVRYLVLF
jgi:hypothetical protein